MNDPNNPTMKPTYPWPSPTGNYLPNGMSDDEYNAQMEELSKSSSSNRARRLTRDVLKKDYPWLPRDFSVGEIVYEYEGYCYGVISPGGTACTLVDNETPFYELPTNSLGPL